MTADDVNPFILTAEERAAWRDRISKMRNEGLFTPPGFEETVSLPGARGGSNWGTSAANPSKGLVYLTTRNDLRGAIQAALTARMAGTGGGPHQALFAGNRPARPPFGRSW
jgi:glucose dehydrogenase